VPAVEGKKQADSKRPKWFYSQPYRESREWSRLAASTQICQDVDILETERLTSNN
jgi:hypothetical protein